MRNIEFEAPKKTKDLPITLSELSLSRTESAAGHWGGGTREKRKNATHEH